MYRFVIFHGPIYTPTEKVRRSIAHTRRKNNKLYTLSRDIVRRFSFIPFYFFDDEVYNHYDTRVPHLHVVPLVLLLFLMYFLLCPPIAVAVWEGTMNA